MMRLEVVPATEALVAAMEPHVRQADVAELLAAGGNTPGQAMREGLRVSLEAWVGLADGEPFCIVGLAPASILGGAGFPWMVGTDGVDRHAAQFLRVCRPMVRRWLEMAPHLLNYVDARNTKAIRWLRWLGFQIHPAQPYGRQALPFHRFEMRSPSDV